jgi:hypothetical protein
LNVSVLAQNASSTPSSTPENLLATAQHWPRPFNNEELAYLLNVPRQKIAGIIGTMVAAGILVADEKGGE